MFKPFCRLELNVSNISGPQIARVYDCDIFRWDAISGKRIGDRQYSLEPFASTTIGNLIIYFWTNDKRTNGARSKCVPERAFVPRQWTRIGEKYNRLCKRFFFFFVGGWGYVFSTEYSSAYTFIAYHLFYWVPFTLAILLLLLLLNTRR